MTDHDTKKAVKLPAGRFLASDFLIGRYAAKVPAGTTLKDVIHPEYFQNELNVLRQGMVINVLSEDFKLDCDLRVETVSKTTVKVRVLRHYEAGAESRTKPDDISDAAVSWGGPNHKWRFSHAGSVIEHGFATEEEAGIAASLYIESLKG